MSATSLDDLLASLVSEVGAPRVARLRRATVSVEAAQRLFDALVAGAPDEELRTRGRRLTSGLLLIPSAAPVTPPPLPAVASWTPPEPEDEDDDFQEIDDASLAGADDGLLMVGEGPLPYDPADEHFDVELAFADPPDELVVELVSGGDVPSGVGFPAEPLLDDDEEEEEDATIAVRVSAEGPPPEPAPRRDDDVRSSVKKLFGK